MATDEVIAHSPSYRALFDHLVSEVLEGSVTRRWDDAAELIDALVVGDLAPHLRRLDEERAAATVGLAGVWSVDGIAVWFPAADADRPTVNQVHVRSLDGRLDWGPVSLGDRPDPDAAYAMGVLWGAASGGRTDDGGLVHVFDFGTGQVRCARDGQSVRVLDADGNEVGRWDADAWSGAADEALVAICQRAYRLYMGS